MTDHTPDAGASTTTDESPATVRLPLTVRPVTAALMAQRATAVPMAVLSPPNAVSE